MNMRNTDNQRTILGVWLVIFVLAAGFVRAGNTCTWTGSWSPLPTNVDDVIVVSSGGNLTWSNTMPAKVASWSQGSGYAGTATFQTVYGATGFTNFTVTGDVTLNGGTWAHQANTTVETNRLCVTVGGNLLVSNAVINVDALGYGQSQGPGAGASGVGGAYGGAASGGGGTVNLKTYGSIIAPTNLGSGGGGVSGGGAVLLSVAGTTTVASAGLISANGASSGGNGGGSGGSISLSTGWLKGGGAFRANGGNGPNTTWGGGSGGRIAIILTGAGADFTLWGGTNIAYGAAVGGWSPPAAGTVYLKTQAGADTLLIDNNGLTTGGQLSTFVTNAVNLNSFSNVVVNHKGILGVRGNTAIDFNTVNLVTYGPTNSYIAIDNDTNVTYPTDWILNGYTLYVNSITTNKLTNLMIGTNGVLSHYQNYTAETYKMNLMIAGNLTVLSNGAIRADTLGYGAGSGPGAGALLSLYGGAYGGAARDAALGINSNTYGSITAPMNLGSGGGGGGGGGAILLTVAGTTTVASAGVVTANGGSSTGNGGGAGGSIFLTTGWLAGSGTLRANGGTGANGNGSGGG
ncbi:MAG: hypothetical protein WCL16_11930, partial [bacterium]